MKKTLLLLLLVAPTIMFSQKSAERLSATAEAIKQYKLNFEWERGYEMWSKVPCAEGYHIVATGLNLEARGAKEIEEIIFGFVSETELKQELIDIVAW